METDRNYFLVGLFVIAMITVGVGLTLWLTTTGKGDFNHYRIRFAESVSGLNKESTVKFRGVDVGNVENISIDPDDSKLIIVDIRVLEDTPVKTNTTATLKLYSIIGDIYVELSGGSEDAPKLEAKEGEERPEIKTEQSSINAVVNRLPQITEKANNLLEKANHIADQINKIFSDRNVKAVESMVGKLSEKYSDKEKPENTTPEQQEKKQD